MAGRRPHHSTNLEAPAPAAPRNSARRQRGTSDGLGWAGSISSRLVPRLVLLWVLLVLFPLAGAGVDLLGLLCLVRARPSVSSVSVSLPVPPRVSKPVESPSPSPSLHSRVIVVDKTPVPRPLSLTITTKNQSSIPQTWSRPVRAQPSRAHRGSPCVWPWPGSGRAAL